MNGLLIYVGRDEGVNEKTQETDYIEWEDIYLEKINIHY